ncbi:MAG: putative membrane protein, partial [Phenylobacterium sp.]
MEIFAFVVFLAIFMFVGILSSRYHSKNQSAGSKVGQNSDIDYLLAGRDVSPL